MTNREWVTFHILWKAVWSHLFLWPAGSEWHFEWESPDIFTYDQQGVSDIAHFVKRSFITSFPMANSKWVTFHNLKGNLITMTNRDAEWVIFHILWKGVSSHFFPSPTGSEWYSTFCERVSHHIFSHHQQGVSDIHILERSPITSFPKREWVTLHILWKGVPSLTTSFPMTNRKWVTLHNCERESHHNFSYDQQQVGGVAHFVTGSLMTSFSMTHRKSVTLHILWKCFLSHCFLWPTGSEWHCTFCRRKSHHTFTYDSQEVSDNAQFVKGSLVTLFPMTNSEWVVLQHILWKGVSSHLLI